MSDRFWGIQDQIPEPKRSFRWVLESNLGPIWTIQIATKPKWEISKAEIKYINHTFKYPGRITWQPIDVTLVDPLNPDAMHTTMAILGMSGYRFPTTVDAASHTLTKENAVKALGHITIKQIGLDTSEVVESWHLKNAWISNVDPGTLSYETDEMVKLKITIEYDWAEHSAKGGIDSVFSSATDAATTSADRAKGLESITKSVKITESS
jgi:hypothetical protein